MLYGLKDCANLTVKSKKNNDIALYCDYAKTSTLEFTSEAVYAYNKSTKAVRWDKSREGTFKTTMEVFNMATIAMLFGSELEEKEIPFMKREVLPVVDHKATLAGQPKEGTLAIYQLDPTDLKTNLKEQISGTPASAEDTYSIEGQTITLSATTFPDNNGYVACYYMVDTKAETFTVDNVTFPGAFSIYGDTALRNTEQTDEFVQFELMNVKPQSNVTLTMDVDNVCTLEITWDIMADTHGDMMRWSKLS